MTSILSFLPNRTPTVFGLDYDGTVDRDVDGWLQIINQWKAVGHQVYIVTMRYPSEIKGSHNSMYAMDQRIIDAVDGMHFTSRGPKGPHMESQGIRVDVWIDDNPKAIHMSAQQIWGSCHPEGYRDSN